MGQHPDVLHPHGAEAAHAQFHFVARANGRRRGAVTGARRAASTHAAARANAYGTETSLDTSRGPTPTPMALAPGPFAYRSRHDGRQGDDRRVPVATQAARAIDGRRQSARAVTWWRQEANAHRFSSARRCSIWRHAGPSNSNATQATAAGFGCRSQLASGAPAGTPVLKPSSRSFISVNHDACVLQVAARAPSRSQPQLAWGSFESLVHHHGSDSSRSVSTTAGRRRHGSRPRRRTGPPPSAAAPARR